MSHPDASGPPAGALPPSDSVAAQPPENRHRLRFRLTRPLSLRQQVLGSILAVLLPSTAFMFYWYPSRQETLALDAARDHARETVELVALAVGQAMGHGDSAGIRAAVDWISQDAALVYVIVTDDAGRPLVRFDPLRLHPDVSVRPNTTRITCGVSRSVRRTSRVVVLRAMLTTPRGVGKATLTAATGPAHRTGPVDSPIHRNY